MAEPKSKRPPSLGPWATEANFEDTARQVVGVGADSALPDEVRFFVGVVKLIRKRIATDIDRQDPTKPAIFLMTQCKQSQIEGNSPKREPMLDNGLKAVSGRLWFVNPAVVTGSYVELNDYEDHELFDLVVDKLLLGKVPAVIFEPRTENPQVRYYSDGLCDEENCKVLDPSYTEVSLDQIFDVIDRVHVSSLITPDAQPKAGKLWKISTKNWPTENAEDMIQMYLVVALWTAFPWCTIRFEQSGIRGRLDIEVEGKYPSDTLSFIRFAILELKVLRSFRSTGKSVSHQDTLDWIESGVSQAANYRTERSALKGALCCFDMRSMFTGDACFDHVSELAEELDIALKLWFLFASARKYRDAAAAKT